VKISLSWLSDYVTWSGSPEELAERLTLAGLNVEHIEQIEVTFPNVVVAEVRTREQHPNADKLSLCTVFDGEQEVQVVCGAPNVRAGLKVLLARVGAVLPGNFKIKKSKIRGEESFGMICSASELGLSDESDGIIELDTELSAGALADELYGFKDTVLDIEVTPNRPDWLSHYGVAREVAALEGTLLDTPVLWAPPSNGSDIPEVSVEISDFFDCPRYTAHIARNVQMGPSPRWMQQRLLAVGMRPIGNVVDITNYVLLELGQPLHAFDRDRFNGKRIFVRRAVAGETLRTLDDQDRKLLDSDLVIADGSAPVAMAGVMGGASSEVTADTTEVLLESASFHPQLVRRTSRHHQLNSESSYRFERGTDWDGIDIGAKRALALLQKHAGATIASAFVDRKDPDRKSAPDVSLRVEQVNRLLGTALTAPKVIAYLQALGFKCQPLGQASDRDSRAGRIIVTIPSFRRDVVQEVDLIEEVARMNGFEQSDQEHAFRSRAGIVDRDEDRILVTLRRHLASVGFHEIVTSSFMERSACDKIALAADDPRREMLLIDNPHHGGETLLRTSALPGLLDTARHNLHADCGTPFRLFQYGREYLPAGQHPTDIRHEDERLLPEETRVLQGAIVGRDDAVYGEIPAALMEAKAIVEELSSAVRIPLTLQAGDCEPFLRSGLQWQLLGAEGEVLGWIGVVAPQVVRAFEIETSVVAWSWNLAATDLSATSLRYERFARYPAVKRDLSLLVSDSVTFARIEQLVQETGGPLLQSVKLFDHFRGGKMEAATSALGIRLKFQSAKGSLKAKAVDKAIAAITQRLEGDLGVTIRS
jgi:phenylalanyl-tRNA synthetase beta chain